MNDKIRIRGARENNLKNIDLTIPRDKLVVFTGLSGSGKSSLAFDTIYAEGQRRYVATTLRIIGGFLTPTSGTVTFDGKVINDVPPYERQINTVFQRYALFPHLNVYDNIAFGLRVAKASLIIFF